MAQKVLTINVDLIIRRPVGIYFMKRKIMSVKGAQTRQNIIEKSLRLFCVKGYYNTSINDILKATGLTKGGLYGHFPSKEDIWYAVYDEALTIWLIPVPNLWNGFRPLSKTIFEISLEITFLRAAAFSTACWLNCPANRMP
jgi:AcrR family transcriptional regulator